MKELSVKQAEALAKIEKRIEFVRETLAMGKKVARHDGQLRDDEVDVGGLQMGTLRALERRGLIAVRTDVVHWTDTVWDARNGGFKDRRSRVVFARLLPSLEEAQQELLSAAVAAADVGPWSPEKARLTRATNDVLAARKQKEA